MPQSSPGTGAVRRPTAGELDELLAPYRDGPSYVCPACGGRVRVLDGPPAVLIGCYPAALMRLAGQAVAAGYLDRKAAA